MSGDETTSPAYYETTGPGYYGQDEPPLFAVVMIDIQAELDAGNIPWPPYRQVEAPPCGALLDIGGEQTNDGVRRRFWCDELAGSVHARHRAVYDLDEGALFTWPADDQPTGGEGPFRLRLRGVF